MKLTKKYIKSHLIFVNLDDISNNMDNYLIYDIREGKITALNKVEYKVTTGTVYLKINDCKFKGYHNQHNESIELYESSKILYTTEGFYKDYNDALTHFKKLSQNYKQNYKRIQKDIMDGKDFIKSFKLQNADKLI